MLSMTAYPALRVPGQQNMLEPGAAAKSSHGSSASTSTTPRFCCAVRLRLINDPSMPQHWLWHAQRHPGVPRSTGSPGTQPLSPACNHLPPTYPLGQAPPPPLGVATAWAAPKRRLQPLLHAQGQAPPPAAQQLAAPALKPAAGPQALPPARLPRAPAAQRRAELQTSQHAHYLAWWQAQPLAGRPLPVGRALPAGGRLPALRGLGAPPPKPAAEGREHGCILR